MNQPHGRKATIWKTAINAKTEETLHSTTLRIRKESKRILDTLKWNFGTRLGKKQAERAIEDSA